MIIPILYKIILFTETNTKVSSPPASPKVEQKNDDNSVQFRRPNTLQTTS